MFCWVFFMRRLSSRAGAKRSSSKRSSSKRSSFKALKLQSVNFWTKLTHHWAQSDNKLRQEIDTICWMPRSFPLDDLFRHVLDQSKAIQLIQRVLLLNTPINARGGEEKIVQKQSIVEARERKMSLDAVKAVLEMLYGIQWIQADNLAHFVHIIKPDWSALEHAFLQAWHQWRHVRPKNYVQLVLWIGSSKIFCHNVLHEEVSILFHEKLLVMRGKTLENAGSFHESLYDWFPGSDW